MDNFDLRKYLAENRLLKPIEEVRSPKGSNVSDEKIRLYLSKDYPGAYSEEEVIEIINLYKTKYRDYKDPYGDLDGVAHAAFVWNKENGRDMITGLVPGSSKSSSPTIDFPELEDEFEGYQDAMLGSDEEYLQGVIDATPEELLDLDGGYYEVALGVEQGRYSAEEAVKLAKAWAKDKLSGLTEGRLLKEFIGGELETRNEPLFDKLVPVQGKAETLEGEMLRAINRMVYRYYNDGDKYYEGYGAETAGPAVSFLVNAVHPLRSEMSRIMDGKILSDNEYENMLKEALGLILDYIEGKEGEYTKNTQGEIFDYESEYEDDDDYYDDYEDDDDYYQE